MSKEMNEVIRKLNIISERIKQLNCDLNGHNLDMEEKMDSFSEVHYGRKCKKCGVRLVSVIWKNGK